MNPLLTGSGGCLSKPQNVTRPSSVLLPCTPVLELCHANKLFVSDVDCRLDYLEKSRKFEDRLKELKSEIHALKLEEKQSGLYSHWNEVLGSLDRSLGNVCIPQIAATFSA